MVFEREGDKKRKQINLCVFTPFWFGALCLQKPQVLQKKISSLCSWVHPDIYNLYLNFNIWPFHEEIHGESLNFLISILLLTEADCTVIVNRIPTEHLPTKEKLSCWAGASTSCCLLQSQPALLCPLEGRNCYGRQELLSTFSRDNLQQRRWNTATPTLLPERSPGPAVSILIWDKHHLLQGRVLRNCSCCSDS